MEQFLLDNIDQYGLPLVVICLIVYFLIRSNSRLVEALSDQNKYQAEQNKFQAENNKQKTEIDERELVIMASLIETGKQSTEYINAHKLAMDAQTEVIQKLINNQSSVLERLVERIDKIGSTQITVYDLQNEQVEVVKKTFSLLEREYETIKHLPEIIDSNHKEILELYDKTISHIKSNIDEFLKEFATELETLKLTNLYAKMLEEQRSPFTEP